MKNSIAFIACCLAANSLFAQDDIAKKYADTITAGDLQKQLTIIASEQMERRETGTEGQRKAASYIQDQFKSFGLLPPQSLNGYQQTFPFYKDTLTNTTLKIRDKNYE